ncbi:hypothetical protein CRUP_018215 [Coryphaenoides rupestris]|nr:hypothetical protein CRUP_018215 [Coryphaenoides rupestris]
MGEPQEDLTQEEEEEEDDDEEDPGAAASYVPPYAARPPPHHRSMPAGRERLHIHKSNVCSRAYFVVVMVFFHVYILNVIALLLYVHYNNNNNNNDNGPGDMVTGDEASGSPPGSHPDPDPDPDPDLDVEKRYRQSYSLPRIEGIRVGHAQRVALMPDRTHEMKTLSLKPLLFDIFAQDPAGISDFFQFYASKTPQQA